MELEASQEFAEGKVEGGILDSKGTGLSSWARTAPAALVAGNLLDGWGCVWRGGSRRGGCYGQEAEHY